MSLTPEMSARHAATLAELAEIGMLIARDLRGEVEAAGTPEAKARAVANFPKVARAVRHCLALEAKFARDAARDAREAADEAHREREASRRRRRYQVRTGVERVIYERFGHGDDETLDGWLDEVGERLDADNLDPELLDLPFETLVARICHDLGLPPPEGDSGGGDDEGAHAPAPTAPAPAAPAPCAPACEAYFRYSSSA